MYVIYTVHISTMDVTYMGCVLVKWWVAVQPMKHTGDIPLVRCCENICLKL